MFHGLTALGAERLQKIIGELAEMFRGLFFSDMLITMDRNVGFLEDQRFMQAFSAEARSDSERSIVWRLHVLVWCAEGALRRSGDFVECGVYRGFSSAVATRYLDFARQKRRWVLFYTFEGIPEEQRDASVGNPDSYREVELHAACVARFAAFPNVEVVRGRVPEVLAKHAPKRVAFLHLDMNSADAESAALQFFFPRLSKGAYVLLDDYGWQIFRAQKLAADSFFNERGYSVLELPTGQGLVII